MLLIIIFIVVQLASANVSLEVTSPIIWRKSQKLPVVGYDHFTHAAVLVNPCFQMFKLNPKIHITEFQDRFLSDCHLQYQKHVNDIVSKNYKHEDPEILYRPSQNKNVARTKRF